MDSLNKIKSQRGLAARIARECNINAATVSLWKKVPPHHAMTVSKVSGIPLHELRPDIYPAPNEGEQHDPEH
jgi:hypothetical protein